MPTGSEALLEEFDRQLARLDLMGHWRGVPRQREAPPNRAQLWKWDDIYPNLIRAGEIVDLAYSDRRTLQLVTPGLNRTSPNTQMSIQLVKPGEVATAHRHMFAATRFIVQGENAYTTVDGEPLSLSAGDYVTTPSWCWHDHANESDQPIIWLDVHDNPFVGGALGVRFSEQFAHPTQPFTQAAGTYHDLMGIVRPPNRRQHPAHQPAGYPWKEVRPALERAAAEGQSDPCDGVVLDYVNPITGGHLLPTLGARIQMLLPRVRTQPHRHTSYTIYHVVEGEGVTVVGDKRFEWNKGDCFTVPNWQWHAHEQRGSAPAMLFSAHDQPILEAFDLYREEREES
ncbi:MAG: cupin domain-containing protein [Chloroflexi bacterium]|nr:cupin domain-containing protein [Chloroflexota bacterium]